MAQTENIGNPGPIGLMGFGMTTILLNIHNLGVTQLDGHILGMGIFVGGIAQIIAGIFEMKKGNTFASTAFTLYGSFWLSFVYIVEFASKKASPVSMAFFLLCWGLFTTYMFIGTLKLNKALQIIFSSLSILFFILVAENFFKATNSKDAAIILARIAGVIGVFCGCSAFYLAMAEILNEIYGRVILPIGQVRK
ncbi:MAG TPA: acetate uptake transporter [Spirochaetota bacterium]|nr:acetate uptake transporter [Spirochaetota bacterium]